MIGVEQTIVKLVRLLRARSDEGARARRRAAATSAMGLGVLALLAAVGLAAIALVVLAAIPVTVFSLAVVIAWQRHGARLGRRGVEVGRRGVGVTTGAAVRLVRRAHVTGGSLVAATTKTAVDLHGAARSVRLPPFSSAHLARRRDAVRANAIGVELRRQGDFATAADHHAFALAAFRNLADRRAEALTLNNLALALEHAGDSQALDLFEESATILGELGDQEHEGQVIANLALAFRRRGQEQESDEALETALGKLDPQSNAYRKAERLRRAS